MGLFPDVEQATPKAATASQHAERVMFMIRPRER
jgi:hypothetical protein